VKTMKKLLILLISVLMTLSFIPVNTVTANTSDTFDITVTGEFLWMEIDEDAWALNVVEMSSVHYTNATDTFTVYINDTSVNVNFRLQITSDGAVWNAATDGNGAGADTYRLNASIDTCK